MIVDAHTHIFPDEMRKNREAFCRRDGGFASIYGDPRAKMVGAEELVASMEEAGISQSVICGFPWDEEGLCHLHNQYLMESKARYPNRLIPFISLPFSNPKRTEEEFGQRLADGAMGVGEVAFYLKEMTLKEMEPMKAILIEMEKKKIPLLLHTNETIGHPYPGKGTTPLERFYELILSFPNLPIILGHWGGGLLFYELMPEVAKTMANVYYDTAASPYLYSKKIYRVAREIVGVEKIIFGSDFPLIHPKRYVRELEESGLSIEDCEKILGSNFLRLVG